MTPDEVAAVLRAVVLIDGIRKSLRDIETLPYSPAKALDKTHHILTACLGSLLIDGHRDIYEAGCLIYDEKWPK